MYGVKLEVKRWSLVRLTLVVERWRIGVGVKMEMKRWILSVGAWRYPDKGSTKCNR